ncbi:hypothetical protein [Thalassoglobus neptunius]|uniref:hypothetical protein n=1 Tax=Thalassoglobus neptunius TaxID=1938619 RepID=UPI0011B74E93|nr:hypothetical protein [Thalassoglobus neptunius]
MSDSHHTSPTTFRRGGAIIAAILFLLLALFLPLIISGIEHFCFQSGHFEDLLRRLGVHDELGMLYQPVLKWVFRI